MDERISNLRNNMEEDDIVISDTESAVTKLTVSQTGHKGPSNQIQTARRVTLENITQQSVLEEANSEEKKRQEELTKVYQLKKLAKSVPIPTNDKEVKMRLRELGKPICLFGETNIERRERLKKQLTSKIIQEGKLPVFRKIEEKKEEKVKENELFYSEGTSDLKQARLFIASYSLPKASYRIEVTKKRFMEIDRIQEGIDYDRYLENTKDYQFTGSQFADERGCTKGALSPNDEFFAVSGNSGTSSVFKIENLKKYMTLKGHTDRVNCINFHPESLVSLPPIAPNIATCSSDTTVKLWTFNSEWEDQKSVTYKGHEERVNNVEFHPTGRFIASSSHDNTWRLWDVEYKKELLVQDGHITHVHPISFQPDGALFASGDLAGIGIIWDLRSGRSIMTLQGHVKRMISIKFSKNSYQVASGSDDNTVKIWDLRKKSCIYTVPAHSKTVSDICFENTDAKFMLTCSYDSSFKMWNNRDWSMVKKFTSISDGKFTSISLTKDNQKILTTSLDRTIRIWTFQKIEVKSSQESEVLNNN